MSWGPWVYTALLYLILLSPMPVTAAAANGDVTLREYIEKVTDARFATVDQRFKMLEISTDLARQELRERLASMNEFRETLKDQAGQFITREVLESDRKAMLALVDGSAERISQLERVIANYDGRFWALGAGLAIFLVVLNLVISYMKKPHVVPPKH